LMFCFIVKIFHNKTLEQSLPFSETLVRFVLRIGYFALGIGIFSFSGARFAENMTSLGVQMPGVQHLRLAGADVWLFMGVTLLVIVQIFKKGIEIQTENELTV
jgi:ABC-type dipeptide/oligopeptide/nickel transport system permease subunit